MMPIKPNPIYTVGHSRRGIVEFVELLKVGAVEMVVDIRKMPRSRTNPQFNIDVLPDALSPWQIGYARIEELGGLRTRSKTVPPEVNGFGRAHIQTRFALDARKGSGQEARFAYKDEADIPLDADLTTAFASEIERNRERAEQSGIVVAAAGVDAQNWKFTRILLSSNEPGRHESGEAYEILHLARPLLDTLARRAAR